MPRTDEVKNFNSTIKAIAAEAEAHRDGERFVAVCKALTRLTNSDEDNAELDEKAPAAPAPEPTHEELVAMFKAGKLGK